MEILGIGPLELLFIILIALIILGPKDLEKTSKSIGKGLTKLVKSDTWKTIQQASEKVKALPNELMHEAELDEIKNSFNSGVIQPVKNAQTDLKTLTRDMQLPESTHSGTVPAEGPTQVPNQPTAVAQNEEQKT
jgi:Sec-independent protein translocase protein TatA